MGETILAYKFATVKFNTKADQGQPDMRKHLNRLRKFGTLNEVEKPDPCLRRSCLGRLARMSTFLVILSCLVAWVSVFLSLQGSGLQQVIPANSLTQVMCVAFFGGLAVVAAVGGLLGNILRRLLWGILRGKEK